MRRLITLLVVTLFASTAPSQLPGVARAVARADGAAQAVDPRGSFQLDGVTRRYLVHLPHGQQPAIPAAVYVVLHGVQQTAALAESGSGFDALADRSGAVALYPDGFEGSWSAGGCCGAANARGLDDVAMLQDMVDRVAQTVLVDRHRVVLVGFSNGGMLAHEVACVASQQVAAIVVVAASREFAPCHPTSPVTVVAVHGADDQSVPLGGGYNGRLHARLRSEAVSLQPYLSVDGCRSAKVNRRSRGPRITVKTWPCRSGGVRLIVAAGLAHSWPGALPGLGTVATITWRFTHGASSVEGFGLQPRTSAQ